VKNPKKKEIFKKFFKNDELIRVSSTCMSNKKILINENKLSIDDYESRSIDYKPDKKKKCKKIEKFGKNIGGDESEEDEKSEKSEENEENEKNEKNEQKVFI
jgi:hypothetical protein